MDPITAIGLAGNILTFIDFGAKVISTSMDIYQSASGSTQDIQNSSTIAKEMRRFAAKLHLSSNAQLSEEERALCNLATKCELLAERILDLLEKVEPKNRRSKGSALVAGIKTKFYEGDRRKLEESLSNCREQLDFQLNHLISSKTQDRLNALVAAAKDDSARVQQLQGQLEHLGHGVAIESLTPNAQVQLRLLLGMSDSACDVITQHRILESLAFEGMQERYEEVAEAHIETLGWIFGDNEEDEESGDDNEADDEDGDEDDDEGEDEDEDGDEDEDEDEDEAKTSARELLLNWVSSGMGIFHISGKLGSGKSTLMKYLCDHKRTAELLKEWAGERQLVFASYFFWKPGSKMQKSLAGLIRSLLHDVCKECPDIIREVLPDYWNQVKSAPWQLQLKLSLSDKHIRDAFSRLISDPKLYTNHSFCFFIDGLDEYEGTHQEDPKTLVDLLVSWTNLAPTTVKLCVSSREYNVFMNAFSEEQRIRLQDLTRSDMTRYVLDKFRHMDRKEDQISLTESIVESAQGIFLWVTLVVKRIREQIENGVNLDNLHKEIESLPKELNDLFGHIIDSLPDSDLKVAYQTYSIVLELNKYRGVLQLLSYSFLDEYTQDHMFAQRESFQYQSMPPEVRALRVESARKRLNACGKGLLELGGDLIGDTSGHVIISHRSISEFLSSRTQTDRMEQYLNGFHTLDAASQLILAELRSRNAGDITETDSLYWSAIEVVRWRSAVKLDTQPYSFLVSLGLAWQRHEKEHNYHLDGEVLGVVTGGRSFRVFDVLQSNPGVEYKRPGSPLRQPIYTAAAAGNFDFVLCALNENPTSIPFFTPQRLLQCILGNLDDKTKHGWCLQKLLHVIDRLHNHHAIHPETASSLFPTYLYLDTPNLLTRNWTGLYLGGENTEVTLWHHILLRTYYAEVNKLIYLKRSPEMHRLGYIVEKFLEYGADPYFYMSVTNSPHLRMRLEVRVEGSFQTIRLASSPKGILAKAPYECENMSLTDLVERWGFENRTRILELIEKNLLIFESVNDKAKYTTLTEKQEIKEEPLAILGTDDPATLEDIEASATECVSCEPDIHTDICSRDDSGIGVCGSGRSKLFGFGGAFTGIFLIGIIIALLMQLPFGWFSLCLANY